MMITPVHYYRCLPQGTKTMTYVWKKEYETGHPIVDFQHRQLFNALFALMEMCDSRQRDRLEATLGFLVGFAKKHVQDTEVERQLSRSQYPFQHNDYHLHDELVAFVTQLESKLKEDGPTPAIGEEIKQYLKDALVGLFNHIHREKEDRILTELSSISNHAISEEHQASDHIAKPYRRLVTPVG
jgi:hemerythrin-like metal-binding protein